MARKQYQPTLIREWRKHRQLTQERLADRVGVTTATISRLENGKQPYTQETLEALAYALNCVPADLLARHPGEPQDQLQRLLERLDEDQKEQAIRVLRALTEAA